jgi:hypothetical protein
MAFKSEAQRKLFLQLVADGKMSQAVFDEWSSGTPDKLPERKDYSAKKIKKTKVIK